MIGKDIPGAILRLDEELALMDWPAVTPAGAVTIGPEDCFLAAMGFEERALSGLKRACEVSRKFHVGVVKYLPTIDENRERECLELCKAHGLDIRQFEYDREHPAGMGQWLADYAEGFDDVYVDISGMSRLLIVQTVVALVQRKKAFNVLYSEAEVYPPLKDEYEKAQINGSASPAFISSGIFEVVSSPELSSVSMLGSAIRLISFLSFDPSQLSNLVQEIQPTHNDVVRGRSPRAEMAWRTGAISEMNDATVSMLRRADVHEVCTFDYRMTLKLVLDLYMRHSAFDRFVITPTGSKMQAIAIGMLRGIMADLQIVYPTPREFLNPGRYTEGVREVFWLPVGDVGLTDR